MSRTPRTAAGPLLLSLALHALLLAALWGWPTSARRGPPLAIESTRVSLDTCRLDPGSASRAEESEPKEHDGGGEFRPRLIDSPPPASGGAPSGLGPTLSPGAGPSAPAHGGEGGARLFPTTTARRVVYVLDRSVSMGEDHRLDFARRELLAALHHLPPAARFQVIAYNDFAEPLPVAGRLDLLPAEPAVLSQVAESLAQLDAAGKTDHVRALLRGLSLRPEVLFFLTDADDLTAENVDRVTHGNWAGCVIHTIELTRRRDPHPDGPLARLARANGGSYRMVSPGSQP